MKRKLTKSDIDQEKLYKRMRTSVDRMRQADAHREEVLASGGSVTLNEKRDLRDIRELLLHIVELVVLSAEEDM